MKGQSPETLLRHQRPQWEKFEVQRRSDILKAAEKLSTLYRSRGAITHTVDRELVCHQIRTNSPTNSFRDFFGKTWQAKVNMGWALLIGLRDWGGRDSQDGTGAVGEGIVMWCAGLSAQCLPDLSDTFQAFLRAPPTASPLSTLTLPCHTPHHLSLFSLREHSYNPLFSSSTCPPPSCIQAKTLKKTKTRPKNI